MILDISTSGAWISKPALPGQHGEGIRDHGTPSENKDPVKHHHRVGTALSEKKTSHGLMQQLPCASTPGDGQRRRHEVCHRRCSQTIVKLTVGIASSFKSCFCPVNSASFFSKLEKLWRRCVLCSILYSAEGITERYCRTKAVQIKPALSVVMDFHAKYEP